MASLFSNDLYFLQESEIDKNPQKQEVNPLIQQRQIIDEKMKQIRLELDKESTLQTKEMEKRKGVIKTIPTVAIIGYTNAGKSRLMNAMLKKDVVSSKDILFQTLQTTTKKIELVSGSSAYLIDTIGFISDLPHLLFNSFSSMMN